MVEKLLMFLFICICSWPLAFSKFCIAVDVGFGLLGFVAAVESAGVLCRHRVY